MHTNSQNTAYIALSVAVLAICSYICIPFAVPFTMQTFGIFFILKVLGGKKSTTAICLYILLGAIGIPVFAGFSGGLGILLGNTGGYILGFILSGLTVWVSERFFGKSEKIFLISAVTGLILCYAFGTLWFMLLYMKNTGTIGIITALSRCVFPFIIPDFAKLVLARFLGNRVSKAIGSL